VVTGVLLPIGAASAAPADTQLASEDPANYTPRVQDGRVQSIVRIGDTVVVGGSFTSVIDATTGTTLARTGIFAFNANTGAVSSSFNPTLAAGAGKTPSVDVVASNPTGDAVYVGGSYTKINGSGPARLQALKLSDGTKLDTFQNSAFSSRVYDVKLNGNTLYVSGSFKNVGGVDRRGIATLDATTGALTTKVNLPFTGTAQGFGVSGVRKIDVTPTGDRLIAIGNFNAVAGSSRVQIAMLNTSGATATLDTWSASAFTGSACGTSWDTYMHDVDMAPDGSFFVVVTTGGWGGTTKMCDTASRWETYGSGAQTPSWTSFTGGDTSWAVEVTGPVAYVGGHFRWWNNQNTPTGDSVGPGGVARTGLAALDTRNGMPFTWDPTRTRGVGVFDFFVTNTELWAGSDTAWWGKNPAERRDRLAAFPWQGGLPLPSDRLGTIPGDVVELDPDNGATADVASRYLVNSTAPSTVALGAGGINWANVRGSFMVNNTLYTGWSDGTFKEQSFDGNSFGAQTTVNVKGAYTGTDTSKLLTSDLLNNSTTTANQGRLSSMFYDPRTGRLYFTRLGTTKSTGHGGTQPNNDGGLFYRYFTPESDIVGATRFEQLRSASVTAIGADTIRGAFLVGDQLYYVTSAGELRKIQFSASGQFVGSSQSVNNAVDWRAKALFLSTQPSVQAPNANPTAAFTQTCVGLSCTFDATGSSDTDGTVASYSWNFGDGSPAGSGATPNHVFTAGNTYPVTLTVTDNDNATGQVSHNVTVAPIASQIAFRAASMYDGGAARTHKWNLPNGIQVGDTIVMAVSGHSDADPGVVLDASTLTPLPGWSEVTDVTDTTRTVIYTKTADASDAGRKVAVQYVNAAQAVKTVAATAVYSGVAAASPVTTAIEDSTKNVFSHTTPGITVPDAGDWVLSYWSDASNSTTDWTTPVGQQVRAEGTSLIGTDTTTVRVSGFLTDDGAPTVAGARSGITATADGKTTAAVMVSLVLQSK
jgi:hypothetical protein